MRLSDKQARAIVTCLEGEVSPLVGSQLFLIGSRTDDSKKGGDIDLLYVRADGEGVYDFSFRLRLKRKLSESLDEQRVDLIITNKDGLVTDPFLKTLDNRTLLKQW